MPIIAGKDRRGLAEIVAIATVVIVIGGTVCLQLVYQHEAARELIVVLAATCGVLPIRGVQSAMERSASSELRNVEANELKQAAEVFRREADEQRRGAERAEERARRAEDAWQRALADIQRVQLEQQRFQVEYLGRWTGMTPPKEK